MKSLITYYPKYSGLNRKITCHTGNKKKSQRKISKNYQYQETGHITTVKKEIRQYYE